ncbi:LexA family transcriptional regulator [uncultured Mitsuokella sp.]|uniref:LexA family protein n=1 Tax=uncultured Mitsuokella sp. TaxID=453120 RepID=UPI0026DAFACB|nr:S24 family peptidase [uncultured Mitsuokella sp.]
MADSTKSVGKLIYDRRTELGITQKEVADFVGVSEATVSRWESGHIDNMRRDRIAALSKILRLSPLAIMGIDDTDLSTRLPDMVPIDARTFRVPIVGRVAAGRPIVADEEIVGYEYIDNKYSKDGHEYFGLRIVGKSMEPTIMDGDIVIVRRQKYVENGEIAIVLIDGEEATAKEVKESADGITLIGHNAAVYTPHFYSAQEVKNLPVQIIGRVVQSIRKF